MTVRWYNWQRRQSTDVSSFSTTRVISDAIFLSPSEIENGARFSHRGDDAVKSVLMPFFVTFLLMSCVIA